MAQKPGIPKGTRDFSPVEMAKRNYISASLPQCGQNVASSLISEWQ